MILQELCDVRAVVELLEEAGERILLSEEEMRELIDAKKRKVLKWSKLSERLGTLGTATSWAYHVKEGDLIVVEKLADLERPTSRFITTITDVDSSSFKIDEDVWFYKDTLTAYTGPFKAVGLIDNNARG